MFLGDVVSALQVSVRGGYSQQVVQSGHDGTQVLGEETNTKQV